MSGDKLTLENLTARTLAGLENENCGGCTQFMGFAQEVLDNLPAEVELRLGVVIGRYISFAALCPRQEPIPPPPFSCEDSDKNVPCSMPPEERKCLFKTLLEMTPEERRNLVHEIANPDPL